MTLNTFSTTLLTACISSFENCLLISLAWFLNWWFVLLGILFRGSSSVSDIHMFGVELAKSFFRSAGCFFTMLILVLWCGEGFPFPAFRLSVRVIFCAVGILSWSHIPKQHLEMVHLCCFRIYVKIFYPFWVDFVQSKNFEFSFSFFFWALFVENAIFFQMCAFGTFV